MGDTSGSWLSQSSNTTVETHGLAEEHHINSLDDDTFFKLHDFHSTGLWSPDEIKRLYGLYNRSNLHVSNDQKNEVVKEVPTLFDADHSDTITYAEFTIAYAKGVKLPIWGLGRDTMALTSMNMRFTIGRSISGLDVKVEDLIRPEDIEHFKWHEEEERRQEGWEAAKAKGIIDSNIPRKFLRDG